MRTILDFETRSRVDLQKVGAAAYASHPSTEIICAGVAIDDLPVVVWKSGELRKGPRYAGADDFIPKDSIVLGHNYLFEYFVYHFILYKRYGWPARLDPKRWDCTMARALTCGLPASLEGAALALKLSFQKDLEGRAALLKICKPQKDGTFNEDQGFYERVYQYNIVDVETERVLDKALPEMTPSERKVFELDCLMNRRGVAIDIRTAACAQKIADELVEKLNADLAEMTGGAVSKASRIQEMKRWIQTQGVKIPTKASKENDGTEKETLDKEAVGDLLKAPETPQKVKDVVSIRQQVGKSSVSKFKAMLSCVCGDGRVRGALQYHGAHTGRWAGRNIQPQNYPQGLTGDEQTRTIGLIREGAPILFKAVYNSRSMQTLSDSLRGMLIPGVGKIFLGADYNAIEARVGFWLAGEAFALAQYARGESPYVTMARLIYGDETITKKTHPKEYDIGKRSILGCGYGMGWVRFQTNVYTETAKHDGQGVEISDELAQKAVKSYRDYYRNVVGLWYAVESAAVKAVLNPGMIFPTADGRALWGMSADRRFLVCKLPSGRYLRYFRPEVRQELGRFGEPKSVLYYWTAASEGAIKTECNGYLGLYKTWGGELVENVVQAVARDIMCVGMLNVEAAGYPLVLTVHDELLAEVSANNIDQEDFVRLMCKTPAWAVGCPIAAEAWTGERYRK